MHAEYLGMAVLLVGVHPLQKFGSILSSRGFVFNQPDGTITKIHKLLEVHFFDGCVGVKGFDFNKPIAIGGDHAGFQYKDLITESLQNRGFVVTDFGTNSSASVDYPDFAHPVANAVERGEASCGILICGSANGVAISANKHQGIRAAICWMEELAQLARQHNNANIICIPARFVSINEAQRMIELFLDTPFEGGRHQNRVAKIACA